MQQISIIGESQQFVCERICRRQLQENVRKNAGHRPTVPTAKPRFGTVLYCGYPYH